MWRPNQPHVKSRGVHGVWRGVPDRGELKDLASFSLLERCATSLAVRSSTGLSSSDRDRLQGRRDIERRARSFA